MPAHMPGLSDILPALQRRSSSIRERIRKISLTKNQNTSSNDQLSTLLDSMVSSPAPPAIAILDSPEVVQKLLEAILDTPGGKRGVSRLARTCRAWKEPALNALWHELDSLAPIIGLFPSHLLKKTRRPGLGLTMPPTEKDWDNILKYAGRVTKITYDEISNNVSTSIFPIFEEHRPRKYLLPNLQHLIWRVTSPENLDRASLFLNSELQGLTLHLGTAGTRFSTLPALLADVGNRMKLRSFSLTYSVTLPDAFAYVLQSQDELERVSIVAPGTLAPAVGKWLAHLPRLKSLQLDLSSKSTVSVDNFFSQVLRSGASTPNSVEFHTDSGVFSGDDSTGMDFKEIRNSLLKLTGDREGKSWKSVFPALTQVQLTGQALNIAAFLTQLSNSLTHLEIVIEDPPNPVDWQHLSHTICERFGSSLVSLRISATLSSKFGELVRSTSRGGTAAPPSRLSLEYLSFLPMLRTISIDLPESVIFVDADIAHLAATCPNLEDVRLCPLARFSASTPPQLSLEGLAPLMRDCRKLNTLAVVINAKGGSAEPSASSQTLNWLHVGHSWVADTLQVAILLSHLAPHLETIKWFTERNRPGFVEANARSWQKVSDILPHMQNLRLSERRAAATAAVAPQKEVVVEYVYVETTRPTMCDKAVDATTLLVDREVEAKPSVAEHSVQVKPTSGHRSVQVRPATSDSETQTNPLHVSIAIDATPPTSETEIDATPVELPSSSVAVQAQAEETEASVTPASILSLLGLLCRMCISYPLSLPLRLIHASFGFLQRVGTPSVGGEDVPLDTLNDNKNACITETDKEEDKTEIVVRAKIDRWVPRPRITTDNNRATRHSPPFPDYIMSEKKQERDFTPEVDAVLPDAEALAKAGKLQPALDKLLVLEKQTRNASDLKSTTRLATAVVQHCYDARDYDLLNSNVSLLSKKHGQLKAAVQSIVELVMGWLEEVKKAAGVEKWLELVQTLRSVTEGKIFLETPRARVTLMLAHYHEGLATGPSTASTYKEPMQTACDLLTDLQVETYSSMERREKTEFILEQMRLLIVVARLKDAELDKKSGKEVLGGGETEWVKVRVGGRKINEEFLKEKDNEDLKLKYYDLMIQHALHGSAYLDVAKYYYKVWETPSIKEDTTEQGKAALEHIVYYIVLAPHSNEQSDMLHHLFADPALAKLELHYNLVKCFTTRELMRWPGIETIYGEFLRKTAVFSLEKQWEDLHTRVIEHNVRVVAQYYTRITLPRLTSLLDLNQKQAEETIARLVVAGTIWARIDRPAGIVNFRNQRSPEDVMNDWSSDMQKLLSVVEKTWMGMNAAQAAQSRVKA